MQPTPPRPAHSAYPNRYLFAVSCSSDSACEAVGSASSDGARAAVVHGTAELPLAERWAGHAWRAQTTTSGQNLADVFQGVSCPSDHLCIAVGYDASDGSSDTTVAERWRG